MDAVEWRGNTTRQRQMFSSLAALKLCPFTVLNMHVQIDLVCLPPQPNHPFPLKTDSFMCRYHVIMCCCAASSDSVSEGLTSRHKGRRGAGSPSHLIPFYRVQNMLSMTPILSLFSLLFFPHPSLYLFFHLFVDLSQHMTWKILK